MSDRIVLAGCGNMGFAMLKGWLDTGVASAGDITVVEPAEALRARAGSLGVPTLDAPPAGGEAPALVVLAVKPQVIREAAGAYRHWGGGRTAFLSVAAGTSIATLEDALGTGTPVIRAMPNTPAAIGKGMIATFANAHAGEQAQALVRRLLEASGTVAPLRDESEIDAVTAVSGSGPAYVFLFLEALEAAGVEAGLEPELAALLARETVWGAASLARASQDKPAELRRQVTSPNGTTAAALTVLMGNDALQRLVGEAVASAKTRSEELGRA
ncbi:MAG: pyrroline-5-carboxylate reductase [Mesorhizobium amorphae]|nr:MAG: pyrroline-5-carboxylate reductase [Mesorhizobium amorphae]